MGNWQSKKEDVEDQFLQEFPQALPGLPRMAAFGVRQSGLSSYLNVDAQNRTWELNETSIQNMGQQLQSHFQYLQVAPIQGTISRINPVTLPPAAKIRAKIPEDATAYCWANPFFLSTEQMEALHPDVGNDPACAFVLYGGFMYFRGQELIRCNSLKPGNDGLFFGSPQSFISDNCRAFQRELITDNCFNAITISFFSAKGARFFAWVPPGTYAGDEITLPHGGFFYLFNEDMNGEDERDVYFKVLGRNDLEERMGRVNELLRSSSIRETDERTTDELLRLKQQLEGELDYVNAVLQQRAKSAEEDMH